VQFLRSVKRSGGVPLEEKVKEFFEKMEMTEPCSFSQGWFTRFKMRHEI
jgi:hypothetical protein